MTRRTIGIIAILAIAAIALVGLHPDTRRAIRNFGEPQTAHDFLYFYDFSRERGAQPPYSVENGRITQLGTSTPLMRFKVKGGEKMGMSLEEAARLQLSGATTSPDGFAIVSGYRPCGANAQCPYIALRHLESGRGREIDLRTIEFGGQPTLIGWVIP